MGSTIQQTIQEHILPHVPQLIRCELRPKSIPVLTWLLQLEPSSSHSNQKERVKEQEKQTKDTGPIAFNERSWNCEIVLRL